MDKADTNMNAEADHGKRVRAYLMPSKRPEFSAPVAYEPDGRIIILDRNAPSTKKAKVGDDVEIVISSARDNYAIGVIVKTYGNIYEQINEEQAPKAPPSQSSQAQPPAPITASTIISNKENAKPEFCVTTTATLYKYPDRDGMILNVAKDEFKRLEQKAGISFSAYHLDTVKITIETLGLK